MIVDFHMHAFADQIADKAVAFLIDYYNIPTTHGGYLKDCLQAAADAGVNHSVLLVAATKPEQVRPANDWILEINRLNKKELSKQAQVKNPPNVITFGTLHPDDQNILVEFTRLKTAGIRGIKLHPDFQGFDLDDPRLFPIFEAMGDTMVLLTHVGDKTHNPDNPSTPMRVKHIHQNFPHLRLVAAHMGGYLYWEESLQLLAGEDIYMDISSTLSFIPQPLLKEFFRRHATDRILFGSDYPLFSPAEELAKIDTMLPDLKETTRERILSRNAVELLGEAMS
jgi:predicted TIM-barrel fold metal-dependent hydrolase